jgi:uncharacterized membrane protein YeaQ/YmgE (transglycosylase-associated protein family)
MTPLDFLILLVVAGVCGAVGQAIVGYSHGGILVSIALGFIGALLGVFLARSLALPEPLPLQFGDGAAFPVIWSIVGSALFVAIISMFAGRRTRDVY